MPFARIEERLVIWPSPVPGDVYATGPRGEHWLLRGEVGRKEGIWECYCGCIFTDEAVEAGMVEKIACPSHGSG